jgi:hypothetical protein
MNNLQQLSPGILAGMLNGIATTNDARAELITEAARRIALMPSHGAVKPIRDELMANGSPSDIIAELVNENVKLRHLLAERC